MFIDPPHSEEGGRGSGRCLHLAQLEWVRDALCASIFYRAEKRRKRRTLESMCEEKAKGSWPFWQMLGPTSDCYYSVTMGNFLDMLKSEQTETNYQLDTNSYVYYCWHSSSMLGAISLKSGLNVVKTGVWSDDSTILRPGGNPRIRVSNQQLCTASSSTDHLSRNFVPRQMWRA